MGLKCFSAVGSHPGIQQLAHQNDDAAFSNDALMVYAIADGVSKSPRSSQASRMAVDEAGAFLERCIASRAGSPEDLVRSALLYANKQVYDRLNLQSDGKRMFEVADPAVSTLIVGLIDESVLHLASVGDSHVYVLGDKLEQLLAEDKDMEGNRLNREVGSKSVVDHHYRVYPLNGVRRILFATDGLYSMLTSDELAGCLANDGPLVNVVNNLIDYANNPRDVARQYATRRAISFESAQKTIGGRDNITGILIELSEEPSHALS